LNDNINETRQVNNTFYYIGVGLLIADIFFNLSGFIFVYFLNKKQNILFKLVGISTRKLIITFIVLSSIISVLPLIFSCCITQLYGFIYSSAFLTYLVGSLPNIAFFTIFSLIPFILVVACVFIFIIIYKFTYNKDINLLLKKVKK